MASQNFPNAGGIGVGTTGTGGFGSTGETGAAVGTDSLGGGAMGNEMVGKAKDAAQNIAGQAKQAVSGLADQARDATADFRQQAMDMKDQALDRARSAADEGKSKAAETIHGVADTIRQSAQQLGQNQTIAPVGRYANQAADALEGFATTLRNKDVDQLVTEVSGFVRRNPAIAVGIAVAAGFAITQLLRGGNGDAGMRGGYAGGFGADRDDDYAA